MENEHGLVIPVPWHKYLYDEEWNRHQLEEFLAAARRIGEKMARDQERRVMETLCGTCDQKPGASIPPPS